MFIEILLVSMPLPPQAAKSPVHMVCTLLEGVATGRGFEMVADDMGLLDRYHVAIGMLADERPAADGSVDFSNTLQAQ